MSFSGTQRFKQNVSNLGGLMSDIKLDVYDWQEGESSRGRRWGGPCGDLWRGATHGRRRAGRTAEEEGACGAGDGC